MRTRTGEHRGLIVWEKEIWAGLALIPLLFLLSPYESWASSVGFWDFAHWVRVAVYLASWGVGLIVVLKLLRYLDDRSFLEAVLRVLLGLCLFLFPLYFHNEENGPMLRGLARRLERRVDPIKIQAWAVEILKQENSSQSVLVSTVRVPAELRNMAPGDKPIVYAINNVAPRYRHIKCSWGGV
ncbi:MAG: hypothetical protein JO317_09465, partial [Verrucomicrobiae bacterium]|nr:hypothetical protein [Verrucomicrobiae bacterium]